MHTQTILDFWFGPAGQSAEAAAAHAQRWFKVDPAFDADIRRRFFDLYQAACAGRYAHWLQDAESGLALLIVLDQFPRNLFRGTAAAFGSDALARQAADSLLARGLDQALPLPQRGFLYLPFMHSEDLADQERCLALHEALLHEGAPAGGRDYARAHRDIIARFGRFPHRNAQLGRASTAEELAFLHTPGSAF